MNIFTIQFPRGCSPDMDSPMTKETSSPSQQMMVVNLPPDLVSVSSCSANDDISDISSLDGKEQDLQEQQATTTTPRSIFGGYWKKTGHEPLALECSKKETSTRLPQEWNLDEQDDENTGDQDTFEMYEKELNINEGRRRPLFPNASTPSLRKNYGQASLRTAGSTSQLNPRIRKTPKSCLRKGCKSQQQHHVSFAPNVSIVEYKVKTNIHVTEGWSKYFH